MTALPTPYYERDGITIYHASCLNVLPLLSSDSVDAAITSPPYNCRKNYGTNNDQVDWLDYYSMMDSVLKETYRVLTVGGLVAINVPGVVRWQAEHRFAHTWSDFDATYKTHRDGHKVVGKGRIEPVGFNLLQMMREHDRHIREPIIWVKGSEGNAICSEYRMGCDSDPYLRPAHEFILLGSKGRWFHRGGTGRRGKDAVPFMDETKDVWFISPERSKWHPAIFPIEIPIRLIRLFTHAVDAVIIDPFMGLGTTLVAAKQLRRRAIGIEIEERYCEIAVKRLAQMVMPL